MLLLIALLCSWLGSSLWLGRRLCWPPEVMPFVILTTQAALLYLAALAGVLLPATYACMALGWGLLLAWGYTERRRLGPALGQAMTPGLAFFLLASLVAWWVYRSSYYARWDEFSHWGLVLKDLWLRNGLSPAVGPVLFKEYPPAAALHQYAVLRLIGYGEGPAIVAHNLFFAAAFAGLLRGVRWRRWPLALALVASSLLAVTALLLAFNTIMVDHLLAVCFAMGVVQVLAERRDTIAMVLRTLPVAFLLPLLKGAGLFLAVVLCLLAALHLLIGQKPSRPAWRWGLLLALVLAPVVAQMSWQAHLRHLGVVAPAQLHASPRQIARSLSADTATPRDRAVLAAFGEALLHRKLAPQLTVPVTSCTLLLGIGVIAGMSLCWPRTRAGRRRVLLTHAVMGVGFLGHGAGVLLLYLYTFSPYEAVRLASFERYLGLFLVPWFCVACYMLLRPLVRGWRPWAAAAGVLAVVGLCTGAFQRVPAILGRPNPGPAYGGLVFQAVQEINRRTRPEEKVYLIFQGSNGFEYFTTRYELAPRLTDAGRHVIPGEPPWSLGAPLYAGDVWTANLTPRAWEELLVAQHYAWVYLGTTDEGFWQRYGVLFDDLPAARRQHLFRVNVDTAGHVRLQAR